MLAPVGAIQVAIICLATLGAVDTFAQATPQRAPALGGAGLPNLGDGNDMTPSVERKLGDRIARELYRDPDYVDDAVLMEYVQGIWQPLLAAARERGELSPELDEMYAWEILLGRDRSINAFALPGAYFGLHLGLMAVVTSRDELASVMAHELSHVTQRHIARMMTRQSQQTPWLLGAMILGVLAASKSPDAANAMIMGGQAVGAQSQLNFSRDMEREADRIGFGVAGQAGFAPQGFVSMFAKLQQSSRLNDSGNFPYLRSHPLSTERMADMESRIGPPDVGVPADGRVRKNEQEMDQAMMAARARVISDATATALRNWSSEVEPSAIKRLNATQQAGVLYGAVLAATKLRDYAQARGYWNRLNQQVQGNLAAERLAAFLGVEWMLAQGNTAEALQLLSRIQPSTTPASGRAVLFLRAQAWIQSATQNGDRTGVNTPPTAPRIAVTPSGQGLDGVVQDLRTWVASQPRDAQAWQLLATAYALQGRTLSGIRAQAEVNIAQLDYQAALGRLRAAQDWVRKNGAGADHFEASIVDTRARYVDSLVREQALER